MIYLVMLPTGPGWSDVVRDLDTSNGVHFTETGNPSYGSRIKLHKHLHTVGDTLTLPSAARTRVAMRETASAGPVRVTVVVISTGHLVHVAATAIRIHHLEDLLRSAH